MKKVVLASLLACAVLTLGLTTAYAQTPVQLGSQAAPVQMPDAEYTVYNNAMTQTNLKAKASGDRGLPDQVPELSRRSRRTGDTDDRIQSVPARSAKTLDAADRILQLDPTNLRALYLRGAISQGKRRLGD